MTNLLTPQEVLQALIDGQEVEYRSGTSEWRNLNSGILSIRSLIDKSVQFRIKLEKQETITVGDVSFPKPYQGEIQIGQHYYIPKLIKESGYEPLIWEDNVFDKMCMANNMLHLSKENAIAHTKALIKLSGGQCE